jgi:hypothetical protein
MSQARWVLKVKKERSNVDMMKIKMVEQKEGRWPSVRLSVGLELLELNPPSISHVFGAYRVNCIAGTRGLFEDVLSQSRVVFYSVRSTPKMSNR